MRRIAGLIVGLALLGWVAAGCESASPTYDLPVGSERDRRITNLRREADMRELERTQEWWEETWMYGKKYQDNPLYQGPDRD